MNVTCRDSFFVGWSERPGDVLSTNPTYPYLNRIDSVVLHCKAAGKAVEMTALVDETGHVFW